MNQQEFALESRRFALEYLSESGRYPSFICGAYVSMHNERIVIEHDEGWTAIFCAGSPAVVLDYSEDAQFSGDAGVTAVIEWLRPL